jgi:hypothetical protein
MAELDRDSKIGRVALEKLTRRKEAGLRLIAESTFDATLAASPD